MNMFARAKMPGGVPYPAYDIQVTRCFDDTPRILGCFCIIFGKNNAFESSIGKYVIILKLLLLRNVDPCHNGFN